MSNNVLNEMAIISKKITENEKISVAKHGLFKNNTSTVYISECSNEKKVGIRSYL